MNIQRLRNLTTERLHTSMTDIYEDIYWITGAQFLDLQLPRAMDAIRPWLRDKVPERRFWDGDYDTTHTGEYNLNPMTEQERAEMWERFKTK